MTKSSHEESQDIQSAKEKISPKATLGKIEKKSLRDTPTEPKPTGETKQKIVDLEKSLLEASRLY